MEGFRLKEEEELYEGLEEKEKEGQSGWARPRARAFQREGKIFRENERRRH